MTVLVISDSKYVVDAVEKSGFLVGKRKILLVKKSRFMDTFSKSLQKTSGRF